MVIVTINQCLIVTNEQYKSIRDEYRLTQKIIERDVDTIIAWYKQQLQLPQHITLDRSWIERQLILNKCSIECTKDRIDLTFSARNLIPDFFANIDPIVLSSICDSFQCFPLPKLNTDNSRVIIYKPIGDKAYKFDLTQLIRYCFMMMHYRMHHDYCLSDTLILDMQHVNMAVFTKIFPATLRRASIASRKVFGARIREIHVINASALTEKLLRLAKACLSPKVFGRMVVHNGMEALYNFVGRDILPKDYGGNLPSCNEISDNWNSLLCQKENVKWLREQSNLKSNEDRRSTQKQLCAELFGVTGSFRSISID